MAVVGTRRANAYGREVAHQLSSELAMAGVTIVSGLARGIDGIAHRAALEAGRRTVAILGRGGRYLPQRAYFAGRTYYGQRRRGVRTSAGNEAQRPELS